MLDQLKRLEDLQKQDAKIQDLAEALAAIPQKVQATENDLARVEALLASEKAQVDDTRKYLTEQQDLLEAETKQMASAKVKTSQAKTPRELSAAQREMEQTREMAQSREVEIKKLVDAIALKEKVLEERSAEIKAVREGIEKDSAAVKSKMAVIQAQLDELNREREKLAAGVSEALLKRYSVIRKRRGVAIAQVRAGTCAACNMNIPPQLFNILRRGTSVESCPYCHRILYSEELMKVDVQVSASGAKASATVTTVVAVVESGDDSQKPATGS